MIRTWPVLLLCTAEIERRRKIAIRDISVRSRTRSFVVYIQGTNHDSGLWERNERASRCCPCSGECFSIHLLASCRQGRSKSSSSKDVVSKIKTPLDKVIRTSRSTRRRSTNNAPRPCRIPKNRFGTNDLLSAFIPKTTRFISMFTTTMSVAKMRLETEK